MQSRFISAMAIEISSAILYYLIIIFELIIRECKISDEFIEDGVPSFVHGIYTGVIG